MNNLEKVDFTVITVREDGSKTWSVPYAEVKTALDHKDQLRRSLFGEMYIGSGQQNRVRDILVVERTTVINEKVIG